MKINHYYKVIKQIDQVGTVFFFIDLKEQFETYPRKVDSSFIIVLN